MKRAIIALAIIAWFAIVAFAPPAWWAQARPHPSPCVAQRNGKPVFDHLPWWKAHGWIYVTSRGYWAPIDGSEPCWVDP